MNKKSYFSQYVSPNILIVPTMDSNAPPAKQRKFENNIVVPIVDNFTNHDNKSVHQQSPTQNKTAPKKIDTTTKPSWASNYLQSIGLAPSASIWHQKIPRKNAPKTSIISINATETSTPKLNNSLNSTKNNILEKHTESILETNKLKDNSRHESKLLLESTYVKANKEQKSNNISKDGRLITKKNAGNSEYNDTAFSLHKKKKENVMTVSKKINVEKIRKNRVRNLVKTNCTLTENDTPKVVQKQKKITSNKLSDNDSKKKPTTVRNPKTKKNEEKSSDNSREINIKKMQSRPSTSYISNNVKKTLKKHINTIEGVTSVKSIVKVTKKYDLKDLKRFKQSKKYVTHKKEETHKSLKNKHSSDKFHPKSTSIKRNKISKSPIKKQEKKRKSYKKIKVIINIICNEHSQTNSRIIDTCESTDISKVSPASNVELDFLNDFNIDEIIESLDTCDVQPNKWQNEISGTDKKMNTLDNDTQVDAIDLIKILKGEEDDDLIGHSIGKQNELFFGQNIQKDQTSMLNNLRTCDKTDVSQDNSEGAIKIKQEKETLTDANQMISCSEMQKNKDDSIKISHAKNIQSTTPSTQLPNKDSTAKSSQDIKIYHDSNVSNQVEANKSQIKINLMSEYKTDVENNNNLPNIRNPVTKGEKANNQKNINNESSSIDTERYLNEISVKSVNDSKKPEQLVDQENEKNNKNKENINKSNYFSDIEEKQNPKNVDQKNTICIENSNEQISNAMTLRNNANEEGDCKVNHSINNQTLLKEQPEHIKNKHNISNLTEATKRDMIVKIDDKITNNNDKTVTDQPMNYNNEKEEQKKPIFDNSIIKQSSKTQEDKEKNIIQKNNKKIKSFIGLSPQSAKSNYEQTKTLKTLEAKELENLMFSCLGAKYSISSLIHNGSFSRVFKCIHRTGSYFALKILHHKSAMDGNKKRMWYSLQENIPRDNLFTVFLVNAFMFEEKWYILMEYYPKNLAEVLHEAKTSLCIEDVQVYARQLVTAVMFLRNNNMVHLDIKPRHILINSSNNILKLCGFDRLCYINKLSILPNMGSANYRAPEVILGYSAGFEIDVWATGVVLFEMATNTKLFPGRYNNEILFQQTCCLGCVPLDMINKSRYSRYHFIGTKFLRKIGPAAKDVSIIRDILKNTKLIDSIYNAYFKNWSHRSTEAQRIRDLNKLNDFVKLLQKMLVIHPRHRLSIEFVYGNQFIYDAYDYHQW